MIVLMPPKDINGYLLRRYHERRAEAVRILGGVCVECGASTDLQIDHRDPADKSFSLGRMWSVSKDRYLAELEKCQLLCAEHHLAKTLAERGQIPARGTHGTLSSYRYCHCVVCREAMRVYNRGNREKRRLKVQSLGSVCQR